MAVQVDTEKMLLLIFSDNTKLTLFRYILSTRLGFHILEAADMNAAQKVIAGTKIGLIILEDWVDGLNGIEFAQLLRNKLGLKKPPIVLCLFGGQHTADEIKNAGIDAIIKTLNVQELKSIVQSLLNAP